MIYLWKIPDDFPERLIGEYDRGVGPDRFIFKQGRRLGADAGTPTIHFKCDPRELGRFDDLANNALVPLVSSRVSSLLMKLCANDVELVDSTVLANGEPLLGYRIVNVVNRVIALDHEESDYSFVPGTKAIMKFKKLRYRDASLGEYEIARDAEYLSNLLVSERLRRAIVEERFHGIGLLEPSSLDMR